MSSPCTSSGSNSLPNTNTHKPVPRHLVTGMHTVADVSCALCGSILGWKYVAAEEESQRYKVGKFILETRRCSVGACWEHDDEGQVDEGIFGVVEGAEEFDVNNRRRRRSSAQKRPISEDYMMEDEIVFDSQDEEECEDLFSGIWSPSLAKLRRRGRTGSLMR